MHDFNGWIELAETPEEIDDGGLAEALADLHAYLVDLKARSTSWRAEVWHLNGFHTLMISGNVNRMRGERDDLLSLLEFVAERLPGSAGLVYERADEMPVPPGPQAFIVHVIARGLVSIRLDPFLSPTVPVVEDP